MVTIAAVNLLRMAPRLAPGDDDMPLTLWAAVGHLRRNALVEAGLGISVLGIVGLLGVLPPGLHTEPGWPLPFKLDLGGLAARSQLMLAFVTAIAGACVVAGVATAAAGRYRRSMAAASGVVLCLGLGAIISRPAIEPAYPTTFYAPAQPYSDDSINRGARLYAANCALCHGSGGKGDGPAAAGLPMRPADLTAPHLFAHTPGDLFWWVSNGRGNGAMPGFAGVTSAAERWDMVNFVRARAAGVISRQVGPEVSASAAPAIPAFAFETAGGQQTLSALLEAGPALLALFSGPPSAQRLAQLAAVQTSLAATGLKVVPIILDRPETPDTEPTAPLVGVSAGTAAALALFRAADDGGETDLLLDRSGDVRARWTARGSTGVVTDRSLAADVDRIKNIPARVQAHAGHTM